MFYYFIRYLYRLGMLFFYRRVSFHNRQGMHAKGPLMIALNHPNSFIDAKYLGTYMEHPIYFIARGDAFNLPWIRKILEALKMIPIFRIRDGKEKLSLNQQTFDAVVEVFRKGGVVLIFVEGFCEHQTELQLPLKKGAPRIIADCWKQGIDVRIMPVWLRYDSFSDYGKILDINFGKIFGREIVDGIPNEAAQVLQVNKQTEKDLLELSAIYHAYTPLPKSVRSLLWPFARLAKLVHAPYYEPLSRLIRKKTLGTTHYDSVLVGILILTYPFYLLIVALVLYFVFHHWSAWLVFLLFPLLAKLYLYWKK